MVRSSKGGFIQKLNTYLLNLSCEEAENCCDLSSTVGFDFFDDDNLRLPDFMIKGEQPSNGNDEKTIEKKITEKTARFSLMNGRNNGKTMWEKYEACISRITYASLILRGRVERE